MFEVTLNFSTTEANQNIYEDFIIPKLKSYFGYADSVFTNGFNLDLEILFDSDYTQNIIINGNDPIKAWANIAVSFDDLITSLVVEGNNTTGQVRMLF